VGRTAQVKATKSRDTIVLVYKKKILNIQKAQKPKYFNEVAAIMKSKDMEQLVSKFLEISAGVEAYSDNNFKIDTENRKVYFKGDKTTPMPQSFINKLKEHYQSGTDYQPLVRFWKKVLKIQNQSSREELFDFMLKSNIPLTEGGDIIVEKGVNLLPDGTLVDCHSRTVDNSIGMTVRMPIDQVDADRRQECSYGLHVGAPDYVRNHWSSDVIVTCVVSPEHVVSVPRGVGATKMRVCEYKVVGFAEKTKIDPAKLIFKLEDIFDVEEAVHSVKRKKVRKPLAKTTKKSKGYLSAKKTTVISSTVDLSESGLRGMTADGIKAIIKEKYKYQITIGNKSKKAIINKALKIILENSSYVKKDFNGMSKEDIVNKVIEDYGVELPLSLKKPSLIDEAIKLSKKK